MVKSGAIVAMLAALATVGSCAVQRRGPDHAIYCSLGKSRDGFDIVCPKPVLNGGWPAPFAFDRPGISVEGRVSFLEDDFRPWPFVADLAFFYVVLRAAARLLLRLAARARGRAGSLSGAGGPVAEPLAPDRD